MYNDKISFLRHAIVDEVNKVNYNFFIIFRIRLIIYFL